MSYDNKESDSSSSNAIPIADVAKLMHVISARRNNLRDGIIKGVENGESQDVIKRRAFQELSRGLGKLLNSGDAKFYDDISLDAPTKDLVSLTKQKPLDSKQVEFIRATLSEYLSSFVIFGYDMQGERTIITNATVPQDKDAMFQMSQTIPMTLLNIFNQGDFE